MTAPDCYEPEEIEEAKAFIKPLLQGTVTAQVERANREIETMKALVEQLDQASSFLIVTVAELADFDPDSEKAERIKHTRLVDFLDVDHYLHAVLRKLETQEGEDEE
jgi:predicted TIM-barrel fold metal-dependent hydrolase